MKKIIIILLTFTMLFSGCEASNKQIENFGAEYSEENKYMVMLPDGISIPITYDDVLELKGESQYSSDDLPYSGKLIYDEIFLDKPCKLGLNFINDNLSKLTYIFECKNRNEADKTINYIYKYLESCYGKPDLKNLTIEKSIYYHAYATWIEFDKYSIDLNANGSENTNIVICEIEFYDTFAGIKSETTTQSYTTTTDYEWKLNTSSTGYDWINVNDTEKEVWCSNSIAAWRVMGYDIPDGVSTKSMVKAIDKLYEDETYLKYDLATISEMFAIANDIY